MKNKIYAFFKFLSSINDIVFKHHGFLFAKSLAFQTILCFIPAIVTIVFFAGYLKLLDQPFIKFQEIMSEQFIPQVVQTTLIEQLELAVNHASSASVFAIVIFLVSSFSLIRSIQEIYFQFSEQPEQPIIKEQIIVYILFIAITTCSLIATSFLAYFLSVSNLSSSFHLPPIFLRIINFLLLSLMIFTFYTFISPIKFNKKIAFLTSIFIGIILYFAQKIFVFYVLWFPGYMLVYGAIAFLPLLFFWLYIYWIIFLYGYSLLLITHEHLNKLENKL